MKQRFGLTLVFMATRSGLTRWQDISVNSDNEEDSSEPHFSEVHNRAIDEIWYKRAVEQYLIENESFVYSVPFDAGDDNSTLVTASNAIFHSDGSREAPAAVIGFQIHHSALHRRFLDIISSCEEEGVRTCVTCDDDASDCFVLDNNGYIILSENRIHTGMFFGEVKGGIMNLLVEHNIYSRIQIYDYQAVCFRAEASEPSISSKPHTPVHYLSWLVNWIFGHLMWVLVQTNLQWIAAYSYTYATDDKDFYSENYEESPEPPNTDQNMKPGERLFAKVMINRTRPQPCDMEVNLFKYVENSAPPNIKGCRPYQVEKIRGSNLVFVVVNNLCPVEEQKISVDPVEIMYNESLSCFKAQFSNLTRRRPKECISSHQKEIGIKLCGHGLNEQPSQNLIWTSLICLVYNMVLWFHV